MGSGPKVEGSWQIGKYGHRYGSGCILIMNRSTMEKSYHGVVDEPKGIRGCPINATAGLSATGNLTRCTVPYVQSSDPGGVVVPPTTGGSQASHSHTSTGGVQHQTNATTGLLATGPAPTGDQKVPDNSAEGQKVRDESGVTSTVYSSSVIMTPLLLPANNEAANAPPQPLGEATSVNKEAIPRRKSCAREQATAHTPIAPAYPQGMYPPQKKQKTATQGCNYLVGMVYPPDCIMMSGRLAYGLAESRPMNVLLPSLPVNPFVTVSSVPLPPHMFDAQFEEVVQAPPGWLQRRNYGDIWYDGNATCYCVLSLFGRRAIFWRNKSNWGLTHDFDDFTGDEEFSEPLGDRVGCTFRVGTQYSLLALTTLPCWCNCGDLALQIQTMLHAEGPPDIPKFSVFPMRYQHPGTRNGGTHVFLEGGFNPYGNGQMARVFMYTTDTLTGERVTTWNMFLPRTPTTPSFDTTITWWSTFFSKLPDDNLFSLHYSIPPESFVTVTTEDGLPEVNTPLESFYSLVSTSSDWQFLQALKLPGVPEVLAWYSPYQGIRLAGTFKGDPPSTMPVTWSKRLEGSFNPYGNGQPGVYIAHAKQLSLLGFKLDSQDGMYVRFDVPSCNYVAELQKLASTSCGEAIGTTLIANANSICPKTHKEKFENGGKKGYKRDGLTNKPPSDRDRYLLDRYPTAPELAAAFFDGVIPYGKFKHLAALTSLPGIDDAFLQACIRSNRDGISHLLGRKELKSHTLLLEDMRKLSVTRPPIYCNEEGVEMLSDFPSWTEHDAEEHWQEVKPKTEPKAKVGVKKRQRKPKEKEKDQIQQNQPGVKPLDKPITDKAVSPKTVSTQTVQPKTVSKILVKTSPSTEQHTAKEAEPQSTKVAEPQPDRQTIEKRRAHLVEEILTTNRSQVAARRARSLLDAEISPDDLQSMSVASRYELACELAWTKSIREEFLSWLPTYVPQKYRLSYVASKSNDYPQQERILSDPKLQQKFREGFRFWFATEFVLDGSFNKSQAVLNHPFMKEICAAPPSWKASLVSDDCVVPDLSFIELGECLELQVPTKNKEIYEATVRRLSSVYTGSHTSTATNNNIDDISPVESEFRSSTPYTYSSPSAAAKDAIAESIADSLPPDPQYTVYPAAVPEPDPSFQHWSSTIADVLFGRNNYIGKGKTAAGTWTGHGFDYSVPALSRADEVAKSHDAFLEVYPEPLATQLTKEKHGTHPVVTALEWNNWITGLLSKVTMIIFLVLFLEGSFNPYGNGQTSAEGSSPVPSNTAYTRSPGAPSSDPNTTEGVLKMLTDFLAGNWQMSQNLGANSDFTRTCVTFLNAVPYDLQLPLHTYTHEQTVQSNYVTVRNNNLAAINMFAPGEVLRANFVRLRQRLATQLDPLKYKIAPRFEGSTTATFAPLSTLREMNAFLSINQNYPNAVLIQSICQTLPQFNTGFILPLTKLFLRWHSAQEEGGAATLPPTTKEAYEMVNPPPSLLNPSPANVVFEPAFNDDGNVETYQRIFCATPRDLNDWSKEVNPANVAANVAWGYRLGWSDFLADQSVAVVPIGPWNTQWSAFTNSIWISLFLEYPFASRSWDLDPAYPNAQWSHTADLVEFQGPKERVLLVTPTQDVNFTFLTYNTVGAANAPVTIQAGNSAVAGVAYQLNNTRSLGQIIGRMPTADIIIAVGQILKSPPPFITDTEIITAFLCAMGYACRLAPDVIADSTLGAFSYTRVGAAAGYEISSAPLPGMLLNGLIPRAAYDTANGTYGPTMNHSQGAVAHPQPAEIMGRALGYIIVDGGTNILTRVPLTSLVPLRYMSRIVYRGLLLSMDNFLKTNGLRRMVAYGPWSGFARMSSDADYVKLEYLINCNQCPVSRPTLISASNPPFAMDHVAWVIANESNWYGIGLYTGIDLGLLGYTGFDKGQLKLTDYDHVATVANNVVFTSPDKTAFLQACSVCADLMLPAPGTFLRLVHDSDRGSNVAAPHVIWRTFNRIIYNFASNDATVAPILDWLLLGGARTAFCWKGYNIPAADLSLGISAMKNWKLYVTLASFNTFPQVARSLCWTVNSALPVKVVDSYNGIEFDDSEVKALRQMTVGDWNSVNRAALVKNTNSEHAPNDLSIAQGFQAFGGTNDFFDL